MPELIKFSYPVPERETGRICRVALQRRHAIADLRDTTMIDSPSALAPGHPVTQIAAIEELRLAALLRQVPLEFARVVYGLNDCASGRTVSMAGEDVARTVRQGQPVTRERAEQRARAYLPVAGQEHCPRCWVFNGIKSPLHYRGETDERPESAACKVCSAEYASALD